MARIALWLGSATLILTLLTLRLLAYAREADAGPPPAQGQMIQTTMGGIYVEQLGPPDGPPVLLAHGSVGWSRMWQPTQTALAALGYRAIAFDMPPMGYSDRDPQADYTRQTQAKRIRALTDALHIKPILVAHSFGAGAAAEAAMTAPQAFAGLVVVSGAIGLNAAPADMPLLLRPLWVRQLLISATVTNPMLSAPLLKSFLYRKDAVTPDLIAMLQRPSHRTGSTAELARWLPALLMPPQNALSTTERGWLDLQLPTAFIWGAQDTVTPLIQGQTLAHLINAPLTVLFDTGHIPQIERPDAFNSALIAALNQMRP